MVYGGSSVAPLVAQLKAEIAAQNAANEPPPPDHQRNRSLKPMRHLRKLLPLSQIPAFAGGYGSRSASSSVKRFPPPAIVTQKDLDRGILSCINRGLIPHTADVSIAVQSATGLPMLCVEPASFHPSDKKFVPHEVMTTKHGLSVISAKVDLVTDSTFKPPKQMATESVVHIHSLNLEQPDSAVASSTNRGLSFAAALKAGTVSDTVPQNELGDLERDPTRTYQELLDVYSLHEFIIRRGKVLSSTPEFASFQRSFGALWDYILIVIKGLEILLAECGAPIAYIDGKKVAKLAKLLATGEQVEVPSSEQLMDCITNREEAAPFLNSADGSFKRVNAAIVLQSIFRMYLQRKRYLALRQQLLATILIQNTFRNYLRYKRNRVRFQAQINDELEKWRTEIQTPFLTNWDHIRSGPRTIVHLASLESLALPKTTSRGVGSDRGSSPSSRSGSEDEEEAAVRKRFGTDNPNLFFAAMQNSQMGRLIDLAEDPNVSVVYVAPWPVDLEAIHYYYALLQAAGCSDLERRVTILCPDTHPRLGANQVSLARTILCSARLIRRVLQHVRGREAYIVPAEISPDDVTLACKLKLPILSAEPAISSLYSSKSGARQLFVSADVAVPLGVSEVFSHRDLASNLAELVVTHHQHQRWLIKVDNEHHGRGIGVLDCRELCTMNDIEWDSPELDLTLMKRYVEQELSDRRALSAAISLVTPHRFNHSVDAFLDAVNAHGAVIEAVPTDLLPSPTVHLFIHPTGQVDILGCQEQILSPEFCCLGAAFPQTVVPHLALYSAAAAIGQMLHRKRIVGYASIDFVAFQTADHHVRIWAVDLDLQLTNNSLAHRLVMALSIDPHIDAVQGTLHCRPYPGANKEERMYLYSGLIHHRWIAAARHGVFFGLCKQRGLSLDIQRRTGIVFQMVGSLLRNCLGAISIGADRAEAISGLITVFDLLLEQIQTYQAGSLPLDEREITNLHHLIVTLRTFMKQQQRPGSKGRLRGGGPLALISLPRRRSRATESVE